MKSIRNARFSGTWYPATAAGVEKQLKKWDENLPEFNNSIVSGIVPHAGWDFSGLFAYDVIRRIQKDTEILVVLGGHLPGNYPVLYCDDEYFETPCGNLRIAGEFIDLVSRSVHSARDNSADNTVEVQLPIIKALFENVEIVPLRVPPDKSSFELIGKLHHHAVSRKIKMSLIGSADLTHYGPNYDFIPVDSLSDPLRWVKTSDRQLLEAMTDIKPLKVLELAAKNQSSCSAGAAASSAYYASLHGIQRGKLLAYDTSYSKHKDDSFVGYGAVAYEI